MANEANVVLGGIQVQSNPITNYVAVEVSPGASIYAHGRPSPQSSAKLKVPSRVLVARGGGSASITVPDRSYSLSGTVTAVGRLDHARNFKGSITASGLVGGISSAELEGIGRSVIGYAGAIGKLKGLGRSITGSATVGGVGTAAIYAPDSTITASGTVGGVGSASILVPGHGSLWGVAREIDAPGFVLAAVGSAVVTPSYKAYAVNTTNGGITEYTNFDFDYIVRFQGRYYGCNGSGIFLLEGADDSGTDISASVTLHPTDFGVEQQKRLTHVYLASRQAATEQMQVSAAPDEGSYRAALTTRQHRNVRAQLPRGVKGRYWSLKFENVNGGPLDIDEIDAVTQVLRRKL